MSALIRAIKATNKLKTYIIKSSNQHKHIIKIQWAKIHIQKHENRNLKNEQEGEITEGMPKIKSLYLPPDSY